MNGLAEELARTDLLRDVPDAMLQLLIRHAQPLALDRGAILLAPERANEHVYLLLSGALSVHFGAPDTPPIRELPPGAAVGEISIIDDTPPSAYVIAHEASRVFPIHRDLIEHLISEANPFARNLLQMLTRWLKANTQRIVKDRLQIWELTDQANVDGLTGLYNRRWLDNALPRLLDQARKSEQALCLLLIDVDHFKRYNDTQGHPGGDRALIAMGEVLKTTVRPYDFAARYGGEEFLVLLPNTAPDEGLVVAERIRHAAEKKAIAHPDGAALPGITVSIGLAALAPGATVASLTAAADQQLYRAKQEGRNRVAH